MQSLKVLKGRNNDRPLTAKEFQQCKDELKEMVLSNGAAKQEWQDPRDELKKMAIKNGAAKKN